MSGKQPRHGGFNAESAEPAEKKNYSFCDLLGVLCVLSVKERKKKRGG
jgi:hypothetical protein